MDSQEIIKKIQEIASEGKISCADARQLAEQHRWEYSQVGEACNAAGIKICQCGLGCF